MAHFAQIDQNNKVLQVIVINNEEIIDPQTGQESELLGVLFCQKLFGNSTRWVQASYTERVRKNFPAEGYTFDPEYDAFYPPKPYKAWVLNRDSGKWEAPFDAPNDGTVYRWNDSIDNWEQEPVVRTPVYYIDPTTGQDVRNT